jgi:hypothetical protein
MRWRNWRPRWTTVVVSLGVISALMVASNAFGISSSLKKAIKKEVAKQLAGKTGPAGANGTNGTNGTNGSALGFATINVVSNVPHVDTSTSSPGITDSMVTLENSNTEICFNGLPFTPKMSVGTVDSNFAVGFTVQTTTANAAGGCTGAEQASYIEVNSTGTPQAPVRAHIAFY